MSTDIYVTDEYGLRTHVGNVHISVAFDMIEHYTNKAGSVVIESAMDYAVDGSAKICLASGSVMTFINNDPF